MLRAGRLLAAGLWLATLALLAAGYGLGRVNGREGITQANSYGLALAFMAFATVGTLIASRRPRNAIGWAFCAPPFLASVTLAAEEYARYGALTRPGSLPGTPIAAWFAAWTWYPSLASILLILLLFPTGAPPTRRWRPALWMLAAGTAGASAEFAFRPGPLDSVEQIPNPFGLAGAGAVLWAAGALSRLLLVAALAAASMVVRFVRSRGTERLQMKWFTYAAVVAVLGGIAGDLLDAVLPAGLGNWVFALVISGIPVSAGVAILRHRLYGIDRIVNRTLVYVVLTAGLAGAYLGGVALLQSVLRPLTAGSDLAVVGSTLAVAALFSPARRRVQSFVDRRFYRRKYDAARTLEAFGRRLRDEVDLAALRHELAGVVGGAMQPAHVSVWLREAAR